MTDRALSKPELDRVREAVYESRVAELTTSSDGKPATFPLTPLLDGEKVIVSSPPAFSGKFDGVRDSPEVSLRFYQPDEPLLLKGTASVRDDDPWAASEYVRELIRDEPDTPKREVYVDLVESLDSLFGRAFMDWFDLRIVVEIEPESLVRCDGSGSTASPLAWDAVGMDRSEAASYERLVFGVVGPDGYPTSWAVADVELRDGDYVLDVPAAPTVGDGQPGCLLLHWHSFDLTELRQRVVRGRCRTTDGSIRFRPGSSYSLRNDTILDTLRFVVDGKKRTRAYFGERSPLKWFW